MKYDEIILETAEMLRISWMEKTINESILGELQTRRELLEEIIEMKVDFFGHACRKNMCKIVKT